jgi:light-regulated signal transduction histidine kinase (bacteriophytochrome)
MGSLIDDLLALARVTRSEMRRQEVDLSALASEIAVDLRQRDAQRTVEFSIEPRHVVRGDPTLLRLALENLLGNSWKYTSKRAEACIAFGAVMESEERVFFVRDNGAGFDPAYADKLFGPFQRLHGSGEFEGTGVGLATVQRIMRRHGGRVWAKGAVGEGATFFFTL